MSKATVISTLNPITQQRVACQIPGSGRLSDHLVTPDGAIIYKNGRPYADEEIFPDDLINIVIPPKGGDTGKDIARTGIILATQVAAAYFTAGMSTWAQIGITAAASTVAAVGANALIPPPSPSVSVGQEQEKFTRLGTLTGTRNQYRPYSTVPRVYGKRKLFPPMSARPYTEIQANQQYQRLLFCVGRGPLHLSVPKIGDTVIGSFDADNVFTANDAFKNIEIEVAEQPDLYSSQVEQTDPGASIEEDGDSIIRTTSTDADEIGIDLTFPQGLFFVDDNVHTSIHAVDFRIEYRLTGATSWTTVDGTPQAGSRGSSSFSYRQDLQVFRALSGKRETLRVGHSWKVPKGQYDVRLTRVSAREQTEDAQLFDSASWTALRTIRYEKPTNLPGVVQVAMRVQATDQINGVLDNFSVEVQGRLPFYDGQQWLPVFYDPATGSGTGGSVTRASNPAWIIADMLVGGDNSNPRDYSEINADAFKDFADNCQAEGRECNIVIDAQRTLQQTVSLVGSTGRGSLAHHDELWTIVQDDEKVTPVQHFTNRNSWDFSSTRSFPDVPHALRINFVNPDADWQTDEVMVYDDGYSFDGTGCQFDDGTGICKEANQFESLDLEGVTSYEQAWKEGRYRLAESRLRPERYTFMADCENLVCQRGDLIYATHDVPLWGIASGRIKKIDGLDVTLDEKVIMEAGKTYSLRVRTNQGDSIVQGVAPVAGNQNVVTLFDVTGMNPGDLFMFGEVGTETTPLKVLSIEPQGDLSARITAIDAAPEIYDADQGAIPDFNSNITAPPTDPDVIPPPAPVITGIRSSSNDLYTDIFGNPRLRLIVSYNVGSGSPTGSVDGEFRKVGDDDGWQSFTSGAPALGILFMNNVERGETYIVRIRARRGELTSLWVYSDPHTAGESIQVPGRPEDAIGTIVNDLDGSYTQIQVDLLMKARKGVDFNIMNELERDLIPITPTADAGPGKVLMQIEEQFIEAPAGSYILKSAHQEEGETIDVPGFDFVGDTLAVIGDELAASMDFIADGIDFGRVAQSQLNAAGEVLMDAFTGTLDDISDGLTYARVNSSSLTNDGLVILSVAVGDLDDIGDGTAFARVDKASLSASGLVLLSGTIGSIDDIEDGTGFGKVNKASLSATGLVLLSGTSGDLDDIADGTNFQRIQSAQLSASGLVLLSMAEGTMDDLTDGTTFGRVNKSSLSAGGIVVMEGVAGDLDDLADGTNFQRVASASLTATGLVILNAVDGDLDDIADGTGFGKVDRASLSATGLVLLSAVSGDIDDISDGSLYSRVLATEVAAGHIKILGPDGQTVIDQGTISTDQIFASEATVSKKLTIGTGGELGGTNWTINENTWIHPSLGDNIFNRTSTASLGSNTDEAADIDLDFWRLQALSDQGVDVTVTESAVKARTTYSKRYGVNRIRLTGLWSVAFPLGISGYGRVEFRATDSASNQVMSFVQADTPVSKSVFNITLDVSGYSDNELLLFEIELISQANNGTYDPQVVETSLFSNVSLYSYMV